MHGIPPYSSLTQKLVTRAIRPSPRRADASIFFVSQNRLFPTFLMLATVRLFGSSTGHPLSLIPHLFRFNTPSIARYTPSDTPKPLYAVRMWLLPPTIGVAKFRLPEKKAWQNPATRNTVPATGNYHRRHQLHACPNDMQNGMRDVINSARAMRASLHFVIVGMYQGATAGFGD